jgi:hypothetical protein
MFPWEHLAVGYVFYSVGVRVLDARPPDWVAAAAVLLGSQFPDLVDKPASWLFDVFPTGVSVAHSVFVAVPVAVAVAVFARQLGRTDAGLAFGTSYLLHLPADALYGAILRGRPSEFSVFLWPVDSKETHAPGGFLVNVEHYLSRYPEFFTNADALRFLGFELLLLGLALALWVLDGTPGLPGPHPRHGRE